MSETDSASPAAARPAELLRTETLAESVMLLLVLTVAQRFVGFLRGVFFCRYMDPHLLGEWDLAFGFLMLAAPVAVLGLPGSFGRYVEYYRQRGQLGLFLRRTTIVSVALGTLGVMIVACRPHEFAELIFGDPTRSDLVWLLAIALAMVIAYNFCISLVTALRMFRLTTILQFVNSLIFAVVALGFFVCGNVTTSAVIIAYGASSLVAIVVPVLLLRNGWSGWITSTGSVGHREFWARLMPFALWMWCGNWLTNMFELVDRYMLIHYSGLPSEEALAAVGQYHSARVVPWVLYSIATMLATTITPHLSHDWEAGRGELVTHRLNLSIKLQGFALTLASTLFMLGSGLLFHWALAGKYAAGEAVLPPTLALCLWGGLGELTMNYLWCRERAELGSVALFCGLVINVLLNLVWVPLWGLEGAVAATAVARFGVMLLIFGAATTLGMRFDLGVWWTALLPATVWLGTAWAISALVLTLVLSALSPRWLNIQEKELLTAFVVGSWQRARAILGFAWRKGWPGRVSPSAPV